MSRIPTKKQKIQPASFKNLYDMFVWFYQPKQMTACGFFLFYTGNQWSCQTPAD